MSQNYEVHLKKTKKYKYPIHETPQDLIIVDLSSIYPKLKNYRLRGKIEGNKLVPYDTRKQSSSKHVPSKIIAYTDSKIDLFFLEIQGSGRVQLDDGKTLYIGYDNQNGHRYRAIGRYLVKIGALKLKNVSLQSIRSWLDKHPSRVNEVLNYNKSVVYFKERENPASGSLGLCLTATRSIAVDRRYIPLGSMLYLNAQIQEEQVSKIVLAQDTGGAIKGAIRADMFLGCGSESREKAGKLKSPLELWILLPKNKKVNI
ncbi:MAG: MltA domain-containing protein [Sulfurimonas sp.]|nr:MltA domain-containing protein [Sulfurimonas sp.]